MMKTEKEDEEEEEENNVDVLHDEHTLRPGQVQVVLLSFCHASEDEVQALLDASGSGRAAEVESILQRPLEPDLECFDHPRWPGGATPLYIAAEHGHLQVARLLLEANAAKQGQSEWRHPCVHCS